MARQQVSPLERGVVVARRRLWTGERGAFAARQRLRKRQPGAFLARQRLWTAEGGAVVARQRLWTRQRASSAARQGLLPPKPPPRRRSQRLSRKAQHADGEGVGPGRGGAGARPRVEQLSRRKSCPDKPPSLARPRPRRVAAVERISAAAGRRHGAHLPAAARCRPGVGEVIASAGGGNQSDRSALSIVRGPARTVRLSLEDRRRSLALSRQRCGPGLPTSASPTPPRARP